MATKTGDGRLLKFEATEDEGFLQRSMERGEVVLKRPVFDPETRALIGDAVRTLLEQDARLDWESDQYPIVTLTFGHIGALIRHKQVNAAKEAAAQYFDRVQELAKRRHARHLERARETLLRFLSTGEWTEAKSTKDQKKGGRSNRRRRPNIGRRR